LQIAVKMCKGTKVGTVEGNFLTPRRDSPTADNGDN